MIERLSLILFNMGSSTEYAVAREDTSGATG
jgi:hypothetical protein